MEQKLDINMIIEHLKTELAEDCSYKSGKVLGSMSTYPDEDAARIFYEFIEKNAGDPNIFLGTHKIERKVISILGDFFHNPTVAGNIVSGGSEANVIGLWAARNYMRNTKKISGPLEIIAPETRHTSIDKAADLLDLKLTLISTNKDFEINVNEVIEKISERTIAIVGIAGSTVYGSIDDIRALSDIAVDHNVWLHVDAAFGGFVFPFIRNSRIFDFRLDGVKSLVVDPHKMLTSPIPNGCILFRQEQLSRNIIHHLPYFSGAKTENRTIIGTKSGAAIIATYFLLKWKGIEWLKARVKETLNNADFLKNELRKRGFKLKGKAQINVFASAVPEQYKTKREKLFRKGWRIGKFGELWRFIVMPTCTTEHIKSFLEDLEK